MIRKILTITIFMLLLMSNSNVFITESNDEVKKTYDENVASIMDSIDKTMEDFVLTSTNSLGIKSDFFSDDYAGKYIDESGQLNILIVNLSQNNIMRSQSAKYLSAKYSYNYLKWVCDSVSENNCQLPFLTSYIDEKVNKAIIEVLEAKDLDIVEDYLRFSVAAERNSYAVKVSDTLERKTEGEKIYGGDRINEHGWIGAGTVFLNAIDNSTGKKGIVTCGHVAPYTLDLYKYGFSGKYIGEATTSIKSFYNDVAFVPFNKQNEWDSAEGIKLDGDIRNNIKIANSSFIIQGLRVVKAGGKTGYQEGNITSTYVSSDHTDLVHDSFAYSIKHDKGDSGAPVMYKDIDGNIFVLGMHYAGDRTGEQPDGTGYAQKVENVQKSLGVSFVSEATQYSTYPVGNGIGISRLNFMHPSFELVIPSKINENPVLELASGAFAGYTDLYKVVIPNTVVKISSGAFENCINLSSVTYSGTLTNMERAFQGCPELDPYIIRGSTNITSHYTIASGGFIQRSNHVYYQGKCYCGFVHINHDMETTIDGAGHYNTCKVCNLINSCPGNLVYLPFDDNNHQQYCETCEGTVKNMHTFIQGRCTSCLYYHEEHDFSGDPIGSGSTHGFHCIDCYVYTYCSGVCSLEVNSLTHHFVCNTCSYDLTGPHYYSGSTFCTACNYQTESHVHQYSAQYIPHPNQVRKHLSYCSCGASKTESCMGSMLDPSEPFYCRFCGQLMNPTGGGILSEGNDENEGNQQSNISGNSVAYLRPEEEIETWQKTKSIN